MLEVKSQRRRIWRVVVIMAVSLLIIGVGAIGGYYLATRDSNSPAQVLNAQLTFTPFMLPEGSDGFTTSDFKLSYAEDKAQILSFVITSKDGTTITLSEYVQPPQFTEIPEYKDRFLSNVAKQYETVQTSNGVVYLGRMAKQDNKQMAVMIEKGLLLLMNPSRDLDANTWRSLVDQFVLQK